jgi:hypothetical protein
MGELATVGDVLLSQAFQSSAEQSSDRVQTFRGQPSIVLLARQARLFVPRSVEPADTTPTLRRSEPLRSSYSRAEVTSIKIGALLEFGVRVDSGLLEVGAEELCAQGAQYLLCE